MITILDSLFENNVGGQGGAVAVWQSDLLVNGTTFTNNTGSGQGQFAFVLACSALLQAVCNVSLAWGILCLHLKTAAVHQAMDKCRACHS